MDQIRASLAAFLRDERGATAIEYGFIAGLVSLAIVASATQIGQSVVGFFEGVANGFKTP